MRKKLTIAEVHSIGHYVAQASNSLRTAIFEHDAHIGMMLISGIVRNAVGPIDQLKWEAMKALAADPCGMPECVCHLHMAALFDALDLARDDWQEQDAEVKKARE